MTRASKIYKSLDIRPTTMGLDSLAFALVATTTSILFMTGSYLALPFMLPLYALMRYLHKKDSIWLTAYMRYSDEGDVYDPWPRASAVRARPKGFGKGLLC